MSDETLSMVLRQLARHTGDGVLRGPAFDAADRIEALEAERDRLREALIGLCDAATCIFVDENNMVTFDAHPKLPDLWNRTGIARAAISQTGGNDD